MTTYWGIDLGGTWLRLVCETSAAEAGHRVPPMTTPQTQLGASLRPAAYRHLATRANSLAPAAVPTEDDGGPAGPPPSRRADAAPRRMAEPRPVPTDYPGLLGAIADAAASIQAPTPDRIGMAIPGTSSEGTPTFVPALPWLEGRPLAADLSTLNGAPTELALDGHLTLLAEATEGAAREARDAIGVTVGTGIGGAVMVDRRIWRGRTGSCGSWGWMPAAEPSPYPRHGDLEYLASGAALRRRARALGRDVAELATATDDDALAACGEIGRALAVAIASLARMLDPELIVLSGGMTTWRDSIGQVVRAELEERLGDPALVVAGQLGPDAAILGALALARRGKVWL